MKPKHWWIKRRDNPQLGTYYVPCGRLPIREAKQAERPSYGDCLMRPFSTEAEYEAELTRLRAQGEKVH